LEYSAEKLGAIGLDPKSVAWMVQPSSNPNSIQILFQAILQVMSMAERLNGMSPNESGQPIVRGNGGVTATEAQQIDNTTTTVYSFVSESIDEGRSAKKRILWESYLAFGEESFSVSVTSRFPASVVRRGGFDVIDDDDIYSLMGDAPTRYGIKGKRRTLARYDYVFSSRDGAERSTNAQSAQTLVQLMPVLQAPGVIEKIGPEKLFEIVNEIFRLSGAGVDLRIDVGNGPDEFPQQPQAQPQTPEGPDPATAQALQGLAQAVDAHTQQIAGLQGIPGNGVMAPATGATPPPPPTAAPPMTGIPG
jgi:hypothetical protein